MEPRPRVVKRDVDKLGRAVEILRELHTRNSNGQREQVSLGGSRRGRSCDSAREGNLRKSLGLLLVQVGNVEDDLVGGRWLGCGRLDDVWHLSKRLLQKKGAVVVDVSE